MDSTQALPVVDSTMALPEQPQREVVVVVVLVVHCCLPEQTQTEVVVVVVLVMHYCQRVTLLSHVPLAFVAADTGAMQVDATRAEQSTVQT